MNDSPRGFTLIEVLMATAVFTVAVVSLVRLFGLAALADRAAHRVTLAPALAAERLEQLRSLAWGIDAAGAPWEDTTTDLSRSPGVGNGSGLRPAPAGVLDHDVTGFVDYLDEDGRWLGRGPEVPRGARFVRRWSVSLLPADPANTLVLDVVVLPVQAPAGGTSPSPRAWVHLTSLKVRTLG